MIVVIIIVMICIIGTTNIVISIILILIFIYKFCSYVHSSHDDNIYFFKNIYSLICLLSKVISRLLCCLCQYFLSKLPITSACYL